MKMAFIILLTLPLLETVKCEKGNKVSPQPTLEEVLPSKTWKLEEIRFLEKNVMTYYKRSADVSGWDQDKIIFNADKTGSYYQSDVTMYSLTWDFTDATKTKIVFTINYPTTPLTVHWENFNLTSTSLKYTEYYTKSEGTKVLTSGHRTSL